jgi:hypothetical protein
MICTANEVRSVRAKRWPAGRGVIGGVWVARKSQIRKGAISSELFKTKSVGGEEINETNVNMQEHET